MKSWSAWEIIRHQVAICGRVEDPQGNGVGGARVTMVSMPDAWSVRISAAESLSRLRQRDLHVALDRTLTQDNGSYYFLDLPSGKYTLKAVDPGTGSEDQQETAVSWDKQGKVVMARLNLKFSKSS